MFRELLSAILDPDKPMPDSIRLFGVRLLEQAGTDGYAVCLAWDEARALAGNVSGQSLRRYLTKLKKSGVLHYSTNANVYVNFLAGGSPIRAGVISGSHAGAQNTRQNEISISPRRAGEQGPDEIGEGRNHKLTKNTRQNEKITRHRREKVGKSPHPPMGGGGGIYSYTDMDASPSQEEIRQSVGMLTDPDVGIAPAIASELACLHRPGIIGRFVLAWLADETQAGALVYRLRQPGWTPKQALPEDRERPFAQRHMEALAGLFEEADQSLPANEWLAYTQEAQ